MVINTYNLSVWKGHHDMALEIVQLIEVFSSKLEESFFKLTKLKLVKEDPSKTLNIPSSQEDAGIWDSWTLSLCCPEDLLFCAPAGSVCFLGLNKSLSLQADSVCCGTLNLRYSFLLPVSLWRMFFVFYFHNEQRKGDQSRSLQDSILTFSHIHIQIHTHEHTCAHRNK